MEPDENPTPARPQDDEELARRRRMALQNVETWVDQAIKQAERRGDFDDLPGAGKPLRHLEKEQDPDWWVKGLIEREQLDLSAAMPSALALRREREQLPTSLLGVSDEAEVRARLEDFNERVLADRRRPHFGPTSPPVVGRVDVEEMVARWREARAETVRAAASTEPVVDPGPEEAGGGTGGAEGESGRGTGGAEGEPGAGPWWRRLRRRRR